MGSWSVYEDVSTWLQQDAERLKKEIVINGNTLIELGYTPAKWFGDAIRIGNELGMDPNSKDFIDFCDSLLPPPPIELHVDPVPYSFNIRAENDDEVANIQAVKGTMDVLMRTPTVVGGAIMPDACPTGEPGTIPVGGVVVTKNAIHPAMHSADVCCSVMLTNLGKVDPKSVLDVAMTTTQFGPGGRKEHGGWEDILYDNKSLTERIERNYFTKDYIVKAAKHLGTQGDGNHFFYVGVLESSGDTVIVTHHGSRGFGAAVYKKGMDSAERFRRVLSPSTPKVNAWIPYDEIEGKLYWEALQIVRDWTKLNHETIHNKVINKLKVSIKDRFWNEHNFVFKEGDLFYHAKGSTPLKDEFVPDNHTGLRLVPLNMAEPVLIVKGETNSGNLGFAPHGAGRNTSRAEHHRRNDQFTKEELFKKETEGLDVRFFSGAIDITELPSAYKNAKNVQDQMAEFGLGEVHDRVIPYGCIMAGEFVKNW